MSRAPALVAALAGIVLGRPAAGAEGPAASPAARPLTFAVVVGNNKSLGQRRPDLHYADDDAARYFQILEMLAPGRVSLLSELDRDTRRLFPGVEAHASAPTRAALAGAGRRLAAELAAARAAGHETELYFVFAGHGDVAQGEGFIELADGRFGSSELKDWLRALPFTRAHVILDSCNSFFMLGVRKSGGRHFATSEDAARALAARLPNVGVFLSTSAEGEAFEWSEIQSGIFSHVVRSGLLGAADADANGFVSYGELAAFVDTATTDVRNPNMRPHVFARGPGAADDAPIARLDRLSAVRRFELRDGEPLRVRLRDASGLPLLDAHTERAVPLRLVVPEAWAHAAILERAGAAPVAAGSPPAPRRLFAVPETGELVTLAALAPVTRAADARGPDETFQALFGQPFGPRAFADYVVAHRAAPPPVYGVSREDTKRMDLLLAEIARSERGKRISESLSAVGFGFLLGGAGLGLYPDDGDREDRVAAIALMGLGAVFVIGSVPPVFMPADVEVASAEFRRAIAGGGDPAQAFAMADQRLQTLITERRNERVAGIVVGTVLIVGSAAGLTWGELSASEGESRLGPRIGWSAGALGGAMMLGESLAADTPAEALARIWRDDPSLNQYQPTVSVTPAGTFLGMSGKF